MVVGMALDVEGRPICCEMWPGNTADVKTLLPVVKRMRERFRLREITVVADRGMVSPATLEAFESLNEEERRKDAHDREAIVAHLKEQLLERRQKLGRQTKATGAISKWKEAATSLSMKNKSKPKSAMTASGSYALTPSIMPRRWFTSIRHCGWSRTFSARPNRSLKLDPSTTSAT
jgi:hypothetical protein